MAEAPGSPRARHCFAFLDATSLPIAPGALPVPTAIGVERVVLPEHRHATVAVSLERAAGTPRTAPATAPTTTTATGPKAGTTAGVLGLVRRVAAKQPTLTLFAKEVMLSPVARLTRASGRDIRCLTVLFEAPGLLALRRALVKEIAGGKAASPAAVDAARSLHTPYDNVQHDGHVSLAYFDYSAGPAVAEAAEQAAAAVRAALLGDAPFKLRVDRVLVRDVPGSEAAGAVAEAPLLGRVDTASLASRAVSVAFLQRFVADHQIGEADTTAQVVRKHVAPPGIKSGLPYATELAPPDAVGPATVFVSHAWRYPFVPLVRALARHVEAAADLSTTATFFWLDVFAINQKQEHMAADLARLSEAISEARYTLLVLSPWNQPTALTRIWCLWEIWATSRRGRPLNVVLFDSDLTAFYAALETRASDVRTALSAIDSQKADATNAADLVRIHGLIRDTLGHSGLNTVVKDRIRHSLADLAADRLEALCTRDGAAQHARFAAAVAELLANCGQLAASERVYRRAIDALAPPDTSKTTSAQPDAERETQHALRLGLAFLLSKQPGGADEAAALDEAVAAEAAAAAEQAEAAKDTALAAAFQRQRLVASNQHAMVLGRVGRVEEALALYKKTLAERRALLGPDDTDTAATENNLAWLLRRHGRAEEALPLAQHVVAVRGSKRGPNDPATLNASQNLAQVLLDLDRPDRAIEMLNDIVAHKREQFGPVHPSTVQSVLLLAGAMRKRGPPPAKGAARSAATTAWEAEIDELLRYAVAAGGGKRAADALAAHLVATAAVPRP